MTREELQSLQAALKKQKHERRETKWRSMVESHNPIPTVWIDWGDTRSREQIIKDTGLPDYVLTVGWGGEVPQPAASVAQPAAPLPKVELERGEVYASDQQAKEREAIDAEARRIEKEREQQAKSDPNWSRMLSYPPSGLH